MQAHRKDIFSGVMQNLGVHEFSDPAKQSTYGALPHKQMTSWMDRYMRTTITGA